MAMITLKEYADRLGKTRASVYSKYKRGDLISARKMGRDIWIDEEEPYIDNRRKDRTTWSAANLRAAKLKAMGESISDESVSFDGVSYRLVRYFVSGQAEAEIGILAQPPVSDGDGAFIVGHATVLPENEVEAEALLGSDELYTKIQMVDDADIWCVVE